MITIKIDGGVTVAVPDGGRFEVWQNGTLLMTVTDDDSDIVAGDGFARGQMWINSDQVGGLCFRHDCPFKSPGPVPDRAGGNGR